MKETKMPTSLDRFMGTENDGVFYIGHASALVRINGMYFMFDPVWDHKPYGNYWTFFPKQINCDSVMPKVSNIFISHIHEDHVCERIITSPEGSIHVLDGRQNLVDRLKKVSGTPSIHKPFKWEEFEDGVECYYVPHDFNSIDSSVFVRSKDFCVYVGSDNFLSPKTLLRVAGDVHSVDVAMVPYAFVHWYPHLVANFTQQEREAEVHRLNTQSLQQAMDFRLAIRPKVTIPFGNNLFYASAKDHMLNRSLAKPTDFVSDPIQTGGFIIKSGPIHIRFRGQYDETFEAVEFPAIDFDFELTEWDLRRIAMKVADVKERVPGNVLMVNGACIDLEDMTVGHDMVKGERAITAFQFDERIFRSWAEGSMTFEQAIGTRRFTCRREPNVYNLKVFEFMNNHL